MSRFICASLANLCPWKITLSLRVMLCLQHLVYVSVSLSTLSSLSFQGSSSLYILETWLFIFLFLISSYISFLILNCWICTYIYSSSIEKFLCLSFSIISTIIYTCFMRHRSFYTYIEFFDSSRFALTLKSMFDLGVKKKKKYHWRWSFAFEDTPITQSVDVHQNTHRFSIFYIH